MLAPVSATLAGTQMKRPSITTVALLALLWLSAGFFTFASYRAGFFDSGPNQSFFDVAIMFTLGIPMIWGPFLLLSVSLIIRKNSMVAAVIAVFVSAATLYASSTADTVTGISLFLNFVFSWVCGLVAIPIAVVESDRADTSSTAPANSTLHTDARRTPPSAESTGVHAGKRER